MDLQENSKEKPMKKLSFLLIVLCIVLFGCPHNVEISNGEKTVQEKQYNTISSLAYIGGSVVYNPANPASAQLHSGANIAVHLGKVAPNTVHAETYKYAPEDSAMKWNEASAQVNSVTIDENSNVYGYLKIQSVSAQAIIFDYHRFITDEKKEVKTYNLQKDKTLDLNKDEKPDLKYTPLIPVRKDFEGAMCLEFISDQADGYTTMYATVTDEALARNTRAFTDYENSTFYGVNPNGSFIYISGTNGTNGATFNSRAAIDEFSTVGLSHGDYIINSTDGEIFAVVGTVPADDNDPDTTTAHKDLSLKKYNDYIVEDGDIGVEENIEIEEFFSHLYRENQFADKENGPRSLLQQLPKEVLISEELDLETCSTQEALFELGQILVTITTTDKIVAAKIKEGEPGLSEEDRAYIQFILLEYIEAVFNTETYNIIKDEIVNNEITDTEEIDALMAKYWTTDYFDIKEQDLLQAYSDLIALNRSCIERYYPESPRAVVDNPEVSSVYPLMSLNISEIPTELNDVSHIQTPVVNTSRGIIEYDQLDDKYKEYLNKKNQIDAEFDKFYSFSLSKIKITGIEGDGSQVKTTDKTETKKDPQTGGSKDKDDSTVIDTATYHFDLKLGVTGSFNSRWGHLDSSLASAIYISVDANLKEVQIKKNLITQTLVNQNKTFMIGPVPITFGFGTEIGLDLEGEIQTFINFAVEFTGMYGAGINFTVDYGKKKSWNPFAFYFTPNFSGHLIQHTAGYAGFVTKTTDIGNSLGGRVVFTPYLKLTPKVALGPQYAYVGINLPLKLYYKHGFGIYTINDHDNDDAWFQTGHFLGEHYKWAQIAAGTSIGIQPVLGVRIPIINKKIETDWSTTELFKGEVYIAADGTLKAKAAGFITDKIN